jgi:hypothetical protein
LLTKIYKTTNPIGTADDLSPLSDENKVNGSPLGDENKVNGLI